MSDMDMHADTVGEFRTYRDHYEARQAGCPFCREAPLKAKYLRTGFLYGNGAFMMKCPSCGRYAVYDLEVDENGRWTDYHASASRREPVSHGPYPGRVLPPSPGGRVRRVAVAEGDCYARDPEAWRRTRSAYRTPKPYDSPRPHHPRGGLGAHRDLPA